MRRDDDSFQDVQKRLDRMRQQFQQAANRLDREAAWGDTSERFATMAADMVEHDDEFVVSVDLPGFESEDVDVRVTDHTLAIIADSEQARDERDERFVLRERRHRTAERMLTLPADVRADDVDASMNEGVLTVTLPKRDPETAHTVDIE